MPEKTSSDKPVCAACGQTYQHPAHGQLLLVCPACDQEHRALPTPFPGLAPIRRQLAERGMVDAGALLDRLDAARVAAEARAEAAELREEDKARAHLAVELEAGRLRETALQARPVLLNLAQKHMRPTRNHTSDGDLLLDLFHDLGAALGIPDTLALAPTPEEA